MKLEDIKDKEKILKAGINKRQIYLKVKNSLSLSMVLAASAVLIYYVNVIVRPKYFPIVTVIFLFGLLVI